MNYIKLLKAVDIIESSIKGCPEPSVTDWIFGQCRSTIDWLRDELKAHQKHQSAETNPLAATWICPDCGKTLPHTGASKRCGNYRTSR